MTKPNKDEDKSEDQTQAQARTSSDSGSVELKLVYPNDRFEYGTGKDDVLTGTKYKKFSSSDAAKVKKAAARHNVQVMER